MPEPTLADWRRQIRAHATSHGQRLSDAAVDEFASHVRECYETARESGASRDEAMAAASRLVTEADFTDVAGTSHGHAGASRLETRRPPVLGRLPAEMAFDLRYAVRMLYRQAGTTAVLVGILAVGIGATTAAYSVIDGVLLKALPYPAPDELVVLRHGTPPDDSRAFAPADWLDYAARRASLRGLAAYASWPMNLTGGGDPERLHSIIVSGGFFGVAGVGAALGRTTTVSDDRPSAPAAVVLSDGFWRRRFGGDPSVINRSILLNDRAATIVGVMPAGFGLPDEAVDLWMPMGLSPEVLADRRGEWVSLVGRLQPGVPVAEAEADLQTVAHRLAADYPRPGRDARITVGSLIDEVMGGARRALSLGGLAALFVLVAGIANAANLMLARATVRRDEMAIRAAIGADPFRLSRQVLVETGVVAVIAGVLGLAISWGFLRVFIAFAGARVPRAAGISLNAGALGVAMSAAGLAACVVGGAAVWLFLRSGLRLALSGGPQRLVRPNRAQGALLAVQVAFALVLLTAAAVVLQSYMRTMHVDPGFDTSDTMTLQLTLPRNRYGDNRAQIQFVADALGALGALPGVTSVGVVSDLPFVANATHFPILEDGEPADAARMLTVRLADPGFFTTLRIPLVRGRYFAEADSAEHPAVAILNRSAAQRYGAAKAIGRRLVVSNGEPRTIVGVVGDIRHAGLHREEGPVIYVPYAQKSLAFLNWMGFVVRTAGAPPTASALRAAIAGVDPAQPVEAVRSMEEYLAREGAPYRFGSLVVGSLAGAALLLALAGVFGLTTFAVRARSRELSLRIALGATGPTIVRTVLGQLSIVMAAGVLAGAAGSAGAVRLLSETLGGSEAAGAVLPPALAAWTLVLLSAGLAALGPAIRATRLDPTVTLQGE
jgi:predicted permease